MYTSLNMVWVHLTFINFDEILRNIVYNIYLWNIIVQNSS